MSPIYNATYLRGLSVTRLRVDDVGRIVEAEGFDEHLRRWAYGALFLPEKEDQSLKRFVSATFTRKVEEPER